MLYLMVAIVWWIAAAMFVVLVAAWHGAQFWAEYLKSMHLRPKELPEFWRIGWNWDVSPVGNFYSDLHRNYGSRFITGCVWTFRIALPALGVMLLTAAILQLAR